MRHITGNRVISQGGYCLTITDEDEQPLDPQDEWFLQFKTYGIKYSAYTFLTRNEVWDLIHYLVDELDRMKTVTDDQLDLFTDWWFENSSLGGHTTKEEFTKSAKEVLGDLESWRAYNDYDPDEDYLLRIIHGCNLECSGYLFSGKYFNLPTKSGILFEEGKMFSKLGYGAPDTLLERKDGPE